VKLPRRYAFRYVRVQVLCGSKSYKIRFLNVKATAISSTVSLPPPFQAADDLLKKIDEISVITLRDCMTTIFEDGPRRDRRLWLGDLRLQALANYYTFKNYDLVKRCLYLFAGFPREDGSVPAAIFERPVTRRAGDYILDYDVLFGVTVLDYVEFVSFIILCA
jgi:alpha-L-rhamnosidase